MFFLLERRGRSRKETMHPMHATIVPGGDQAADSIYAGRPNRNGVFLGLVWVSEGEHRYCYDQAEVLVASTYEEAVRGLLDIHEVNSPADLILYTA